MLSGELRNQIDRVWDALYSGGISNPLMAIEQIACQLMFGIQRRRRLIFCALQRLDSWFLVTSREIWPVTKIF